ncbi:sulfite exporter TauE/SafE family protein [Adhaeribacter rhizoryzae]|uniref:Sulfite exporter TauE/SafE family protein n=1 Tax=Adhaeribacter rhizoryzae TaxID=2607907 RepID=A0A5M6D1G5_9BACT|nr:sulfite exporter TauE/SafE family protein [Adhaeribacter rhizoryzae]KAA5541163.1 sulfite exporter TauE/SafE family protein [Adhaeribacter rhizoryzae]
MVWAGFLMGLLGSFHCLGMCGPIAVALPVGKGSGWQFVAGRLLYNGGRIITYAGLGLVAGAFGQSLQLVGIQQLVSIVAGVLILILAVMPALISRPLGNIPFIQKTLFWVRKTFAKYYQKQNLLSLLVVGLLNGLLPCGFVYIALAGAIAMKTLPLAMTYMALFGLGTLPMMLLVSLSGKLIKPQTRFFFKKAVPYMACIIACLFILRGLNLGIPYVSPKAQATTSHHVTMACCHKK